MVANFLQNKWDMKFNDIPITEDIGQQTIEQYRDNVVLKDNIEAEGIIIQIIPLVLRINLITVIFDLNNKGFVFALYILYRKKYTPNLIHPIALLFAYSIAIY